MSFDRRASLRRIKPQRRRAALRRREPPFISEPMKPGRELLLDTTVYIDLAQKRALPRSR